MAVIFAVLSCRNFANEPEKMHIYVMFVVLPILAAIG